MCCSLIHFFPFFFLFTSAYIAASGPIMIFTSRQALSNVYLLLYIPCLSVLPHLHLTSPYPPSLPLSLLSHTYCLVLAACVSSPSFLSLLPLLCLPPISSFHSILLYNCSLYLSFLFFSFTSPYNTCLHLHPHPPLPVVLAATFCDVFF